MPSCPAPVNCSAPHSGQVRTFSADPDIGGIGVILAFIIPAWSAFCLVVFSYVSGGIEPDFLNRLDHMIIFPRSSEPLWVQRTHLSQQVTIVNPEIRRLLNTRFGKFHMEKTSFQRGILSLLDSAIITGVAVLIVGFAKHCTITQYHFNIVSDLGWLAAGVLGGTVQVIAPYLNQRRAACHWRAIIMVTLNVLVIVSFVISSNNAFATVFGQPVQCIWNGDLNDVSPFLWPQIILVVWNVINILRLLYPRQLRKIFLRVVIVLVYLPYKFLGFVGKLYLTATRHRLQARQQAQEDRTGGAGAMKRRVRSLYWLIVAGSLSLVYALCFTIAELLRSQLLDIIGLFTSLLWPCRDLITWRNRARSQGLTGDENTWGFGQVIPMVLLALPASALLELMFERREEGHSSSSDAQLATTATGHSATHSIASATHLDRLSKVRQGLSLSAQGSRDPTLLPWTSRTAYELGIEQAPQPQRDLDLIELERRMYTSGKFRILLCFEAMSVLVAVIILLIFYGVIIV